MGGKRTRLGSLRGWVAIAAVAGFAIALLVAVTRPSSSAPKRVPSPQSDVAVGAHPANFVNFIYGSCSPPADLSVVDNEPSCYPPAQLQVWPACARNRSMLDSATDLRGRILDTTVDGTPAAIFPEGTTDASATSKDSRLEVYTGDVTVVIWSRGGADSLRDVAARLAPVNELAKAAWAAAGDRLPSPVPGALSGALHCTPTVESPS